MRKFVYIVLIITLFSINVTAQSLSRVLTETNPSWGWNWYQGATFDAARTSAVSDNFNEIVPDDLLFHWARIDGSNWVTARSHMTIDLSDLSADSMIVDSISISFWMGTLSVTENYSVFFVASTFEPVINANSYNDFVGWAAGSGVYTNAVIYTDSLNTANMTMSQYAGNEWMWTSAGIDSFTSHFGDSLKIMSITSGDYFYNAPTGLNLVGGNAPTNGSNQPLITIYYTKIVDTKTDTVLAWNGSRDYVEIFDNDTSAADVYAKSPNGYLVPIDTTGGDAEIKIYDLTTGRATLATFDSTGTN